MEETFFLTADSLRFALLDAAWTASNAGLMLVLRLVPVGAWKGMLLIPLFASVASFAGGVVVHLLLNSDLWWDFIASDFAVALVFLPTVSVSYAIFMWAFLRFTTLPDLPPEKP